MKRKGKEKEIFVCERCGNPIAPDTVKCKWCKKVLRPEYYIQQQKEREERTVEDVSETI